MKYYLLKETNTEHGPRRDEVAFSADYKVLKFTGQKKAEQETDPNVSYLVVTETEWKGS